MDKRSLRWIVVCAAVFQLIGCAAKWKYSDRPNPDTLPDSARASGAALLEQRDRALRLARLQDIQHEVPHEDYYRFIGSAAYQEATSPNLDPDVLVKFVNALNPGEHKEIDRLLRELAGDKYPFEVRLAASDQIATHQPPSRRRLLWLMVKDFFAGGRKGPFQSGDTQRPALLAPDRVRLVAIGDFGTPEAGDDDLQNTVGRAIRGAHGSAPFDFGITLGDNFYPWGFDGSDPGFRWARDWDEPYGGLRMPFFPALGNHDWYGGWRGVTQQIVMRKGSESTSSPDWTMPGPYYEIDAGPLRLLAIDTHRFLRSRSDPQRAWLQKRLAEKRSGWTIVYGHHPMYSGGSGHGSQKPVLGDMELRRLRGKLKGLLKDNAQVFLAGHEHDMQIFERDSVLQVIAGTSGKTGSKPAAIRGSHYCGSDPGYLTIDATADTLTLALHKVSSPGATSAEAARCVLRRLAGDKFESTCSPRNCQFPGDTGRR